jgi:HSP20 family protein
MVRSLWDRNWDDPFVAGSDWDRPLSQLRSAVDRLFEGFGAEYPSLGAWGPGLAPVFPRMNLSETADQYTLEAEVPGLRMDQIEITCSGHDLTLRGEREAGGEAETSYARRERPVGVFTRTVSLPAEIDADKVTATLEDGILEILVPKSTAAKPRKIAVKATDSGAHQMEGPVAEKTEAEEAKK